MRYTQFSMSFSSTCLMYDISRTNLLYQSNKRETFCSHCLSSSMCVSLDIGLVLQLHMEWINWNCASNSEQKDGELVFCDVFLYFAIIIWSPWWRKIFIQFILILVGFEETLNHFVREVRRISTINLLP